MPSEFSRRRFVTSAGFTIASPLLAAIKKEDKSALPVISKRIEKMFLAPGKHPNDLDSVADGLWILDQTDPNKAHKVAWADGKVLAEVQTESMHGSGIAYHKGALWISSTASGPCQTCLKTLKVDAKTGKTLAMFDSPGAVEARMGRLGRPFGQSPRPGGSHGIKFVGEFYWQASPPAVMIYKVEAETGKVAYSIPAPGARPHGLAWDNGSLWCVESNDRAVYKMDPETGDLLAKIQLTKDDPEPHGLTLHDGVFWYCDASSGWVCRLV